MSSSLGAMGIAPPGIEGEWNEVHSGGTVTNWLPLKPIRHYTNAFIWSTPDKKILLGYKKRGFGFQMYNGFGGKVEPGESPLEAAKRELQEEAGIDAPLEKCGLLLFHDTSASFMHQIHIFRSTTWQGSPSESEEMRPEWFSFSNIIQDNMPSDTGLPPIPFKQMWQDDPFWFPLLLECKPFAGRVDFSACEADGSGGEMIKYWFGVDPLCIQSVHQ